MDNIAITISDPGLDWLGMYIGFGISAFAIGFALFAPGVSRLFSPYWDSDDTENIWIIASIVTVLASFIGMGFSFTSYDEETKTYQIAAMEEAGFSDVDLGRDKVVASFDGAYFHGELVENGKDSWLVVETAK